MLRTVIGYTAFRDDIQFLRFKQDYIHNAVWKTAFYIHVFSAIITLFAGFMQFSSQFLKEHWKIHRLMGKIYVWNILAVNFPAGMVMAIYANGGWAGKTAFILLNSLWFYFTCQALIHALHKDFVNHRKNMIRSYALTFSAITLRTWKIVLSHVLVMDMAQLYIMDAWLGFIPNLLMAEWIIRSRKLSTN